MTGNACDSGGRPGTEPAFLSLTRDEYHADPCEKPSLSASIAKLLVNASPAHAREAHPRLRTIPESAAEPKFDLGTCVHSLILEGRGNVAVLPFDDWRSAAAREQRALARADGLTPLLQKDWDRARAMEEAIWRNLDAHHARPKPFQGNGQAEQTIIWEERGVQCRARLDWLPDDLAVIDDLKTTSASANPEQWCRSTMFSIGADIQAAFYRRGVQALTGETPEFRFVVAETFPPYALSIISPGPAVLALAEKKLDYALDLWRRCGESGEWPAYTRNVCHAELPPWEEARWLERELREAAA